MGPPTLAGIKNIAILDGLFKLNKIKEHLTLTQKVEPTKPMVDWLDIMLAGPPTDGRSWRVELVCDTFICLVVAYWRYWGAPGVKIIGQVTSCFLSMDNPAKRVFRPSFSSLSDLEAVVLIG